MRGPIADLTRRSKKRVSSLGRRHRKLALAVQQLEPRNLLAGDLDHPWAWFHSDPSVPRLSPAAHDGPVDQLASMIGPRELVASEWIVQLTGSAVRALSSLESINHQFDRNPVDFTLIEGLGSPGLVLLRGRGVTDVDIEETLDSHAAVASFNRNGLIEAQSVPNDPDYQAGLLSGLQQIGVASAWQDSPGSSRVVVGVVDSGIDAVHPDLFLNIWLNQGEIPSELRGQLTDVDDDGLITFYDLNNLRRTDSGIVIASTGEVASVDQLTHQTPFAVGLNADAVEDRNGNGRIDAIDLLDDVSWADGRDSDGNTFFDDLFGVNFRSGQSDPFAVNRPLDELGHGTHVAGTIGAIGDNQFGVVGVNWQTSLMSLRILDNNNQSETSAAIRAVNYAKQMRASLIEGDGGRVDQGADVRVLNNSWGQPGGFDLALESVIAESGEQGILFVAAAGNGNLLGVGVDNDQTAFYPAGYETENVVSVAAASPSLSGLARFSNFGADSVDLAAPGVNVRSTLPGGAFGPANGTSMATPHVAGTAALIWSAMPGASVAEVRTAILASTTAIPGGVSLLTFGGVLNASAALDADVFAPTAQLISKQDIRTAGGAATEFTVAYSHRSGIDVATIGDDDLVVSRSWGPESQIHPTLKPGSIVVSGTTVSATYRLAAPGGSWDPLDFGDYLIASVAGAVSTVGLARSIESRPVGSFHVRVESDEVYYVDAVSDSADGSTLRDAIIAANSAGLPRTIILDQGTHTIDRPPVTDPTSTFPDPSPSLFCGARSHQTGWSGEATGDFDITGDLTIVGNQSEMTVIDGQSLDRLFKVHPGATLSLQRVTLTGGVSAEDQGGGAILSAGELSLHDTIIRDNTALGGREGGPIRGGGVAVWDGVATIERSWIDENVSDFGGGLFFCGTASGIISQSTLSENRGGGLHSHSQSDVVVSNSTFSGNIGGLGAIYNGQRDLAAANSFSTVPVLSGDGRFLAFASEASNLVAGDTNGTLDVFVLDRQTNVLERVSVDQLGQQGNGISFRPSISDDGRYVAFESGASNLVPGDTNGRFDVFVYDRLQRSISRVSVSQSGIQGNRSSDFASISGDGQLVAFASTSDNLVPGDSNGSQDIFVYDRTDGTIQRVSVSDLGEQGDAASFRPSISGDGRMVAFASVSQNLVAADSNSAVDVFVFDRQTSTIERVSVNDALQQANGESDASQSGPTLSVDGRYVAFDSIADNLVGNDSNGSMDVFVFDRLNDSIERISIGNQGAAGNDQSSAPTISADGRYVAFESAASNLVDDDTNSFRDIFIVDRDTDSIERISINDLAEQANGRSIVPDISDDGRFVAYATLADNVVTGDINGVVDILTYDRQTRINQAALIAPTDSSIDVTQSTIVNTAVADASIAGAVDLNDVLLSSNQTTREADQRSVTSTGVIDSLDQGSELIGPLTQFSAGPPVHPLRRGNPAIDAGDLAFAGTVDQRGVNRVVPDVGAFEADSGAIGGVVYIDLNENQTRDVDEPGLAGIQLLATSTTDSLNRATVFSSRADAVAPLEQLGGFHFDQLEPDEYRIEVDVPDLFTISVPTIRRAVPRLAQPNGGVIGRPSLTDDGTQVAIQSSANNLVAADTNGVPDIFAFNRTTDQIQRVSVGPGGVEGDGGSYQGSISGNGRFVVFDSDATNLVDDDTNNASDVFVYDLDSGDLERVSINVAGLQANDHSFDSSISGDGRFVAFASYATQLVPTGLSSVPNLFVVDRSNGEVQLVSVSSSGTPANGASSSPRISADGRFVVFESSADNLVAGDANNQVDIFVHDRITGITERVSLSDAGTEANNSSFAPSINSDGRWVTFSSSADNLVAGDTNGKFDVFLYDTQGDTIRRVSVSETGNQADNGSFAPWLSGDGRFIVFESFAKNLVPGISAEYLHFFVYDQTTEKVALLSVNSQGELAGGGNAIPTASAMISGDGRTVSFVSDATNLTADDTNSQFDPFVVPNPLVEPGATISIEIADANDQLNFGLVPHTGTISGRLFEDLVENGVFDAGEPPLVGRTVFLDANDNRSLDDGERFATSDASGAYVFAQVPTLRQHSVVTLVPPGFEQVAPGDTQPSSHRFTLPAGAEVSGRDFVFRRVSGTGQSSSSSVSGRIFDDKNENGVFDFGTDQPLANAVVYLDAANFGVRDPDEPAVETAADGTYSINRLGASVVSVATILDELRIHSSPLGSDFDLHTFPLFNEIRPFGNPQAIATGDFNDDSFPDVAVALSEANLISIRLNDGQGGFLPDPIDIDLGASSGGPTSLVVGQFNGAGTPLDLAVANQLTSNITVMLDYSGSKFASMTSIPVGDEPIELVAAEISGDSQHVDLVVVNRASEDLYVLINDGSGGFSSGVPIATGGVSPVAIVAGQFVGSDDLDIAVAHGLPSSTETPFGDVRLLAGDGFGGFTLQPARYLVGATPTDLVTADFDSDGRLDLAVSNFSSNSLSVLTGNPDGSLTVQDQTLGTSSGAFDITLGDMDNDGDIDVIASNLLDRNISIFRNATTTVGQTRFQPLEGIGLGQFGIAQRMPLAVANFDQDGSAPGQQGTLDIVAIPRRTDTLHVLSNTLVNGAHRVALTGLNQVAGLDFIIKDAALSPTLDSIPTLDPIDEDAGIQAVTLTGIAKGRAGGPALRTIAESSNADLVPDPTIEHVDGQSTATLRFQAADDENGQSIITVRIIDAGADQIFDTDDDVSIERPFEINVIPLNDPPTFALSDGIVLFQPGSGPQSVAGFVTGISPGGGPDETNQGLSDFVLTTDVDFFDVPPAIDATGTLTFTPATQASGIVIVEVRLSDDGGTENQGIDTKLASFAISSPRTIVIQGDGNTISLSDPQMLGVELIDMRGSGDNLLLLDAEQMGEVFPGASVKVIADRGDQVSFDSGWQLSEVAIDSGHLVRTFHQSQFGSTLRLVGPADYTNPVNSFDVSGNGSVTSLDALRVINELRNRFFSDGDSTPRGVLRAAETGVPLERFAFFDVSADQHVTALDALRVINELARQGNSVSGELEALTPTMADSVFAELGSR